MLKISHATMSFFSGLIWAAVGIFLLQLGLRLILDPAYAVENDSLPILSNLRGVFGGLQEAGIALVAIALYIGFLKGKHVLRRSARSGVERLRTLPNPAPIYRIYNAKYYILLAIMIGLGMSMRYLALPNDIRGGVDVAIGAALINGAMEYFRLGLVVCKKSFKHKF